MSGPKRGDVILCGQCGGQFTVIDAATDQQIAGPVKLSGAIQLAKASGAAGIWQQNVDERGRALSPPMRIPFAS